MSRPARRIAAAVSAAVVLSGAMATGVTVTPAGAASQRRSTLPVTMAVQQVAPSAPVASNAQTPLAIAISLTNTSSRPLTKVRILAERGDPIGSQRELDLSLADAGTHTGGLAITPTGPVITDIPAGSSRTVVFRTTTSLQNQGAGICLCHDAVYPLDLSAHETSGGADTLVGATRTYLPSFDVAPSKLAVSWVWPLLDRPHRLTDGTVFTDDSLTGSVSGGRLDSALQVLEEVAADVPVTVVLDPELLDELTVMAAGNYTVREAGGRGVPGIGQAAAQNWLARLRALLEAHPSLAVALTPYGDPDVQSLSERRLPWASTMPSAMAAHVSAALGGRTAVTSLAWVAGGRADARTVTSLARTGVHTVLLDARAVAPSSQAGIPLSLADARGVRGGARLALTSPALQGDVAASLSQGAIDPTKLPLLVSELAARVAQSPTSPHAVVLTPPRYVNPSPGQAVRTIEATVHTPFSKAARLSSVLDASSFPSPAVRLRAVGSGATGLSGPQLDRADMVHDVLPAVSTMLARSVAGQTVSGQLPHALQRMESSAWRADGLAGGRRLGAAFSAQLSGQVNAILSGVQIVKPSSGSYTLAGSNSPVPITVRNDLPYAVAVNVTVTTLGNLPGLVARRLPVQVIPASSKVTLKIPTSVQRSGRIPVDAVLSAPNDYQLGHPVTLFIHSTVLGTIGIVITVVAGVVLVLALLVRYLRRIKRLRARRRRDVPPARPGARVPSREPAR